MRGVLHITAAFLGVCVFVGQATSGEFRYSPVDGGRITSSRGWRLDPFGSGKKVFHHGWDIAVPVGTPVYATRPGTVHFSGWYKGYGFLVVVNHHDGWFSMVGHNAINLVKAGQQVGINTIIARSGNTGRSTGPHVHYEFRYQKQIHQSNPSGMIAPEEDSNTIATWSGTDSAQGVGGN